MRTPLLACLVLAQSVLLASSAGAGTLDLRWDACWGDGGAVNKSFACDSNDGTSNLIGSFVMPATQQLIVGEEITLDIAVAGGALPAWWQFVNAGSCRENSLGIWLFPPNGARCQDWLHFQAAGGITSYSADHFGPGSARLQAIAYAPGLNADLFAGTEYFSFWLLLPHARSVGAGACAGCELGACLALTSIKLLRADPDPGVVLTVDDADPAASDDRLATWQGGAGVYFPNPVGGHNCYGATPTRRSTWGAVKSLYR